MNYVYVDVAIIFALMCGWIFTSLQLKMINIDLEHLRKMQETIYNNHMAHLDHHVKNKQNDIKALNDLLEKQLFNKLM